MVEREKVPYGYIYRATNVVNGKVYLGQTTAGRWKEGQIPIQERWKEEVGEAHRKQARGEDLRYIENAITKYGPENFVLVQQDIAYSQAELDQKETNHIRDYNSMDPEKGYNLKEGGMGGRLSDQAKEKVSNSISDKYQSDPEYYQKQLSERQDRATKNPEWHRKMTEINRERAKNPQWKEKMSQVGKEKWQEREYNEKQLKERKERVTKNPEWHQKMAEITRERAKNPEWRDKLSQAGTNKWKESEYREKQNKERQARAKDPEWLEKMREIGKQYRKEIPDKRAFLKDIKENVLKKDMLQKYDMGKHPFDKRIQEMLGLNGPKNYSELKEYMKDKNINEVLNDIEDRAKENETKPSSETETPNDKEEPKTEENEKDNPEIDSKKDEEEKSTEKPEDGDEGNKSENGEDDIGKEDKQENPDDKAKGENTAEETVGEGVKPEEPDYAGIDEDPTKKDDIEKNSDMSGIIEATTPRSGIKYDIHNIEIKESKEKVPRRKDGEVPKWTSDVNPNSLALEKRLVTPPRASDIDKKHKDLAGLDLNLNVEIIGGDFSVDGSSGFGGEGGGRGDEASDYEGVDRPTEETDEKTEGEGEDGSEGEGAYHEV